MHRIIIGRHRAPVARMQAAAEKAGCTLTPEMNDRIARITAPYKGVNVVPAVFTDAGFKEALAQATDSKAPLVAPAEKKENVRTAIAWLRKMAVGEMPGYDVRPAEAAMRSALFSDD